MAEAVPPDFEGSHTTVLADLPANSPHITLFDYGPISVMYYTSHTDPTNSLDSRSQTRSRPHLSSGMGSHTCMDLNGIPVHTSPDDNSREELRSPTLASSTLRPGAGIPQGLETQLRSNSFSPPDSRKLTSSTSLYRSPFGSSNPEVREPFDVQNSDKRDRPSLQHSPARSSVTNYRFESSSLCVPKKGTSSQSSHYSTSESIKELESLLNMPTIEMPGSLPVESDAWKITTSYSPRSFCASSSSTASTSYLRTDAFAGHRDTLARIRFFRKPAPHIPASVLAAICRHLSFQDYKSLRLTSKVWLRALSRPKLPSLYFLPREVIQEIYKLLRPQDFDAARHTCRAWLLASLDRSILIGMLRKNGSWRAAELDLQLRGSKISSTYPTDGGLKTEGFDGPHDWISDKAPVEIATEEWLLSKRLATECMLSSEWRGSSLPSVAPFQRFFLAATLEFKEYIARKNDVGSPTSNLESSSSPMFTVSGCGKYLLMSEDCVISVYEILAKGLPTLKATTSIHCPCKVRAVSMDTSCGRYAVAALLDCRMGIVCDVQDTVCEINDTNFNPWGKRHSNGAIAFTSLDSCARGSRRASQSVPQKGRQTMTTRAYTVDHRGRHSGILQLTGSTNSRVNSNSSSTSKRPSIQGIHIDTGPRTIYRNLGSVEDPPRSVAICPQRRCVAFGCGLGVELHWVDAMSEADLNRWFPLSAPADFLFFLPPKAHADNPSKLRLISSAARKGQLESSHLQPVPKQSINTPTPPVATNTAHSRFMTRLFFGKLPSRAIASSVQHELNHVPSRPVYDSGLLRTVECDHYHAVPLADGAHMLFTDPETGLLCLGSDAPLGNPTKLLRKVVFVPPNDALLTQDISSTWPTQYIASSDLQRGLRIVASYNDHLVLYNLPADIFEEIRKVVLPFAGADNLIFTGGPLGNSDLLMDAYIPTRRASTESTPSSEDLLSGVAWGTRSLRLQGVTVGYLKGVETFSVECKHGGVRVWAFSRQGMGRIWDIERNAGPERKIVIRANGNAETIGEPTWRDDVLMEDDLSPEWEISSTEWETSSSPSPLSPEGKNARHVSFFDGSSESDDYCVSNVYRGKKTLNWIEICDSGVY